MAANGNGNGEMKAHVGTYSGFIGMMKWGTVIVVALTAIVVLLIAN